jgi:type III pantothenate kinase
LAADTLAGLTEYGAPLIVVDAGTVTTIIAVDKDRTYLGGCILPGIRLSAQLLKETTALLPSIELGSGEEDCLGRNSAGAMRCGLLLGGAMMVDGFLDRYTALPGMAGARCVATGGSAALVTARCRRELIQDPELTLKGLRYLYELNRPKPRRY